MKAKLLLIIMTLSVTFNLNAQSYKDLWKDVNKNLESRLPESAESFLDKIEQSERTSEIFLISFQDFQSERRESNRDINKIRRREYRQTPRTRKVDFQCRNRFSL